jgi:hypothetical protein
MLFNFFKKKKKMNQIINDKLVVMNYPIGYWLANNLPIITEMANSFKTIDEFKNKDINLVCTGSSGAIISAIFSTLVTNKIQIHHIKKDGETSHCGQISKIDNKNPIIFIDDFIHEGITINRVYNIMRRQQGDDKFEFDCIIISDKYMKCGGRPKYLICGKKFAE